MLLQKNIKQNAINTTIYSQYPSKGYETLSPVSLITALYYTSKIIKQEAFYVAFECHTAKGHV
jgi:hypothetical protein